MSATESKFKVGDRVRVVRHRAFSGNDVSDASGLVGKIITLGKTHRDLESDLFETFSVVDAGPAAGWLIRSDDIESAIDSGPIRTVTRREIVPGVYGDVTVERIPFEGLEISYKSYGNAHKLREAAHIFNQIAEALEEQAAGEQQKEAA